MSEVEDEIVAEGVEIIWVLEQSTTAKPGTAERCAEFMFDKVGSKQGWCVGDSQTEPTDVTNFDDSPFSIGRGFDILVTRDDMKIVYTTNHGTPSGNDNPSGQEVLEDIKGLLP